MVPPFATTTNFPPYNNYQDAIGMTTSISSFCYFINNQFINNGAGVGAYPCDNCVYQGNIVWGNGVDPQIGGITAGFQSCGFDSSDDYAGANPAPVPLNGDPMRGNKYMCNRFMNNGQYGNTHVITSEDSPMYSIGLPFLITSVFQNPNIPIPVNANIQETPSIFLRFSYSSDTFTAGFSYFLSQGLPVFYSELAAAATSTVFEGASVTLNVDIWQGMASSTVPIVSYTLNTPNGATIGPQPGNTFTLNNLSSANIGSYYVTVEFDIGTLPSPPALSTYNSNTVAIMQVYPQWPTWSATVTYALGALVQYEGVVYESVIAGNLGNIPSATSTVWAAL